MKSSTMDWNNPDMTDKINISTELRFWRHIICYYHNSIILSGRILWNNFISCEDYGNQIWKKFNGLFSMYVWTISRLLFIPIQLMQGIVVLFIHFWANEWFHHYMEMLVECVAILHTKGINKTRLLIRINQTNSV